MIFYCPKCGKTRVDNFNDTMSDIKTEQCAMEERNGSFTEVYHLRCECGNYLAGVMLIGISSYEVIERAKAYISKFNKGGDYYSRSYAKSIKKKLKLKERERKKCGRH